MIRQFEHEVFLQTRVHRYLSKIEEGNYTLDDAQNEMDHITPYVTDFLTQELPQHIQQFYRMNIDIRFDGVTILTSDARNVSGIFVYSFSTKLLESKILPLWFDYYSHWEPMTSRLIAVESKELLEYKLQRFDKYSVEANIRYVKYLGIGKKYINSPSEGNQFPKPKRDSFFVLLVILCATELLTIILLVYGAIIKTYF